MFVYGLSSYKRLYRRSRYNKVDHSHQVFLSQKFLISYQVNILTHESLLREMDIYPNPLGGTEWCHIQASCVTVLDPSLEIPL